MTMTRHRRVLARPLPLSPFGTAPSPAAPVAAPLALLAVAVRAAAVLLVLSASSSCCGNGPLGGVHALVGPQPSVSTGMPSPSFNTGGLDSSSSRRSARRPTTLFVTGGGGGGKDSKNTNESSSTDHQQRLKDYGDQMAALFGNVRIPSALFAGASAGAAFAMPLATAGGDGLKLGLVKRLYALLMMSALSCQLLVIIVCTLAMGSIAVAAAGGDSDSSSGGGSSDGGGSDADGTSSSGIQKATSMAQYIELNYNLEWVTTRLNFMAGILFFVMGAGLRAWVTLSCPIFARASLGIIASSTLLAVAFVEDTDRVGGGCGGGDEVREGFVRMTIKYVTLLMKKSRKEPLFAAGMVTMAATWGYVAFNVPHVWQYLVKTGGM